MIRALLMMAGGAATRAPHRSDVTPGFQAGRSIDWYFF